MGGKLEENHPETSPRSVDLVEMMYTGKKNLRMYADDVCFYLTAL